jgi:exopolyphosphatase/pppGpp-phosphohydrolase
MRIAFTTFQHQMKRTQNQLSGASAGVMAMARIQMGMQHYPTTPPLYDLRLTLEQKLDHKMFHTNRAPRVPEPRSIHLAQQDL